MIGKEDIRDAVREIPVGWDIAFGDALTDELYEAAIRDKMGDDWCVLQAKEKFGELRIYPTGYGDNIEAVIDKYEELSRHTCAWCGKPATRVALGWISPYCDTCMAKHGGQSVAIEEFRLW